MPAGNSNDPEPVACILIQNLRIIFRYAVLSAQALYFLRAPLAEHHALRLCEPGLTVLLVVGARHTVLLQLLPEDPADHGHALVLRAELENPLRRGLEHAASLADGGPHVRDNQAVLNSI